MDRTVKLWWVTGMKYSAWPHCSHHSLNLAGDIWFLKRIFSLISGYFCQWSNLGKMSVCTLYFQGNCCMHLLTWILKIFWSDNLLLRPNVLIEWFTGYMPAYSAGLPQSSLAAYNQLHLKGLTERYSFF